ncbi:MAG TPA: T9SS type A sorting domain-containing protein [Cytophagales bacterium]|nr:T9SS type A sorting domain-containing protein [Cytophagales bacterium]
MKNKFLILLLMMALKGMVTAQNPYWVFPPNYVDFKTGQVKVLPTNMSYTKTASDVSNGFFSQSGVGKFVLKQQSNSNYVYPSPSWGERTTAMSSTENLLVPGIDGCNTYWTPSLDVIVGDQSNAIFCLRELEFETPYYQYWSSFHTHSISITSTLLSTASTRPRAINGTTVVFDLYTLTKSHTGYYELHKITYTKAPNSWVTNTATLLCTFSGNTLVSEMDISRDEKYLAWGDMGSGKLFVYNLNIGGQVGLSTFTISGSKVNGVEFSKNSNFLYFTKYAGASPGVGVYNCNTNTFAADVPATSDLQNSQLELSIDGNVYGYNGTQLRGFASESYTSGIIKTYNLSNPLSVHGVYTLVDQVDNLDYDNAFSFYSCKPVEYISGNITGVKTYAASVGVSNTGTTSVANAAVVNITGGNYITFNPGFNTGLSSSGYVRATIQPCGASAGIACASYRTEAEAFLDHEHTTLTVYPNPISSGFLNFSHKVAHFKLTNTSGTELLTGTHAEGVAIDGLPKGVYLMHLDDKVVKVVIQ